MVGKRGPSPAARRHLTGGTGRRVLVTVTFFFFFSERARGGSGRLRAEDGRRKGVWSRCKMGREGEE